MLEVLKAIALALAGVYNAILAYEAYRAGKVWWRILASALTALALLGFSAVGFGLLA